MNGDGAVNETWKAQLSDQIPAEMGEDIDKFETQLLLRQQDKIEEKLFAETRLRMGAYGQRYDNAQRHDGIASRTLAYDPSKKSKGVDTAWDAPGMTRIKIPFGRMTVKQLEVLAECAEEYSDGILHITTRQDIQLHFIHIEDTPDMYRRLAAVGITTKEACGNGVRNVTACPFAGVCSTESFDVRPYANATARYLLGHPDTHFGRKFKIAFSGCKSEACALVNMHDLGAIATVRQDNGKKIRGFEVYVGGGLGSVPHQAKLIGQFVPEEEFLPLTQAICRVYMRLGEKKNRARARIKFLVAKLGIEEFSRLVEEERQTLPKDERWQLIHDDKALDGKSSFSETPLKKGKTLEDSAQLSESFRRWRKTNIFSQVQPGYATATIRLPLGDFTSKQARSLAKLARKYCGDTLCATVEQNLVFRWISEADLPEFYQELEQLGLGSWGAGNIQDVTSCPGTDTCKLGISASRGLASELMKQFEATAASLDPAVQQLRVKCSGCFNSCGQHHISDLGFLGVSRNVGGRRVPHFQMVLGGQWTNNAGSYGLAIGAIPSKKVPAAIELMTKRFVAERQGQESFQDFVQRIGKVEIRNMLKDIMAVPSYEQDPSYYSDWRDPREYTIGDIGVGECAGEIVPTIMFGLADAERLAFEAQIKLDEGDSAAAADIALSAMVNAAKALVRVQNLNIGDDAQQVVEDFRKRFYDTKIFHDPYAGGKFAHYLFSALKNQDKTDKETAHRRVEEALLFIEATHACYDRMQQQPAVAS